MTITLNGTTGVTTPTGVFSDASGNVGIGTTSPATKLNLSANAPVIRLTDSDTSLSDGELSSGIDFYQSDSAGAGVGAAIGAYGDGTDGLLQLRFSTGADTEAMRIAADGIVTGTAGNLMLVSGTAVTTTSGTAVNFTGIPSWVKRITVMFKGVSLSGSSDYLIQIGAGSVTDTGYLSTAGYSASGGTWSLTTSTAGFCINSGSSTRVTHGSMSIMLQTTNTWVSSGNFASTTSNTSGNSAGSIALSGTLDRIRITTINGTDTFDAGSINIMYE
jgi:hypothetical protein